MGLTRKDCNILESDGNPRFLGVVLAYLTTQLWALLERIATSENPMEIQWKSEIPGGGASVPKSQAVGLTRKDCNIREADGNPMAI